MRKSLFFQWRLSVNHDFSGNNFSFLKQFLKNKQVPFSNSKKNYLVALCRAADELQLEIDPEGMLDSRCDVIVSI